MLRYVACWLLTLGCTFSDILVTTPADSGPGSLRQAVVDAQAAPDFDLITFDPAVFTGATAGTNTITLQTPITVNDPDGVRIDGSGIPSGVTVSGGGVTRLFFNQSGSSFGVECLNLTAAASAAGSGNGGAIRNEGDLELLRCCLYGNSAGTAAGGAISSTGPGNRVHLENCTFSGNTAAVAAIHLNATEFSVLLHCTISQNHGTTATGGCGGLVLSTGSIVRLENTLLAGNTAAGTSPPDVNGGASNLLLLDGVNLIGVRSGGLQDQLPAGLPNASGQFIGTTAAPVPPGLGVLAGTRGPTRGMAPLAGSLALDRIASTPLQIDQAGEPRVDHGLADVGALEARLVFAEAAWDVRFAWKQGLGSVSAATAGFNFSVPGATHRAFTSDVIAFRDDSAGNVNQGRFTHRQRLWPINNQTPQGILDSDDDEFHMHARTHISITGEDDYTFGFASDDGARLRIFSTDGSAHPVFLSATPLNPDHPTPVHFGNTLTHDGGTSFSDTLGVVHLMPGNYLVEFDYVEGSGFSHAEVFAARGAKTEVDGSFRLIGDRAPALGTPPLALTPAGWAVHVFRNNPASLAQAVTNSYDTNAGTFLPPEIMGLRFSSAADHPERDPMTFKLEGALTSGVWVTIATGSTQLPAARLASSPLISLENVARYRQLRITFPTVRDAANATAMQVGEVEFLDAFGTRFGTGLAPEAIPSAPLGDQGPGNAGDGDPATAYVHPAVLNAGFDLITGFSASASLSLATSPTLHFHDPDHSDPDRGHGFIPAPFPGDAAGSDDNHFASVSRGLLKVAAAGDYTFCAEISHSLRLRIIGSRGWQVRQEGAGTATPLLDGFECIDTAGDVLGQVHLLPGSYEIEVFQYDATGPANVGLWVAGGFQERFDETSARYFSPVSSAPSAASGESTIPFTLTRAPGETRPVNDDFTRALNLYGVDVTAFGSNLGGTIESNETNIFSGTRSVWWRWTAPASGPMQVVTFGSEQDTTVSLYTGSAVDTLSFLDGRYYSDINGQAAFPFHATAGTTYHFQISVTSGQVPGLLRLHLGPANDPANNDFGNAIELGSTSPVVARGDLLNASAEDEPGYPNGSTATANVWYRWTAPDTGKYLIDTRGSGFSGTPAVFTGETLATLAAPGQITGVADDNGYTVLDAVAGTSYAIAVDVGNSGHDSRYCLNIAHVGRHEVVDPVINEDGSTYMIAYIGDTAYQRTLRCIPATSNPTLLPATPAPGSSRGVQFVGISTVTFADIAPEADQSGKVSYTQSMVFDRIPTALAFSLTVNAVNDVPSFTPGPDITATNSAAFIQDAWASAITAGPADEAAQTLQFSITGNTNPGLFLSPVVISPGTGRLSFIPNPAVIGSSTITLQLRDNGGTSNGGADSNTRTFTITTTGVTPYTAWAAAAFGGAVDLTGPEDDFDHDGVPNLLEFILGGNPLAPTPGGVMEARLGRDHLTLRFTRDDASEGTYSLSVQTSPDLVNWTHHVIGSTSSTTAERSIVVTENGPAADEVVVEIPRGESSRIFARISAE